MAMTTRKDGQRRGMLPRKRLHRQTNSKGIEMKFEQYPGEEKTHLQCFNIAICNKSAVPHKGIIRRDNRLQVEKVDVAEPGESTRGGKCFD
ncbi:hypothetical protein NECAME_08617 [Necator americanus]|uniref:Uncharacterized protein n=1 Tax=Necator americanus TaxID=51031 RepID=W2TIB6_NECAM|nr:hypothetical protein NECAME_08617 [Necator americanus]ETN81309.1 hypothetical protein NECAME_08617 [Necator americanus]